MKNFGGPSFYRMFDLLVSATNSGSRLSNWTWQGVELTRERHSFAAPRYSLSIEIFTLIRTGRRGWHLMVTKEYWWAGDDNKVLRSLRWARTMAGKSGDVVAWLKEQESVLERRS